MFRGGGVPRTRGVLVITATAAAVITAAAIGQTTHSKPTVPHDPNYPSPYDNSKTDQVLRTFDKKHPECASWTDWHKLCSRSGANGATSCKTDAEHPTTPSSPFCVVMKNPQAASVTDGDTPSQRASRRRFSYLKSLRYYEYSGSGRASQKVSIVRHWRRERPFNGTRFAQIREPLCEIWWFPDPVDGPSECTETGSSSVKSCSSTRIDKLFYKYSRPHCEKWLPESPCYHENIENIGSNDQDIQLSQNGKATENTPIFTDVCE